jgi:hypothetical protein
VSQPILLVAEQFGQFGRLVRDIETRSGWFLAGDPIDPVSSAARASIFAAQHRPRRACGAGFSRLLGAGRTSSNSRTPSVRLASCFSVG